MPVRCSSCNYLVADPWAGGCPLCGSPLPEGTPRPGVRSDDEGGSRRPLYLGLAAVFVLAAGFGLLNRNRNRADGHPPGVAVREEDTTGRVRVGMPMAEVARVIDADAGRPGTAPDAVLARFPDIETKSGMLAWVRDGRALAIPFRQGRVARVLEVAGTDCKPERLTVVYHDPDHPGDDEP
jgi:hypothetical protein